MGFSSQEIIADPIDCFPCATVACFDPTRGDLPRRELDEDRTAAFLNRLGELGAPGMLIAASTGHGHLRTVEELETWLRCAARADIGHSVREALLRPEDGLAANERLLDLAAELEFPIVFFRPGADLPAGASDEQVVDNLQPLTLAAARRGLAVGLYSIPDVSGLPLSANAAAQLVQAAGGENIIAVKVTEADYEASTKTFLTDPRLAQLKVVQGWDPHLARALQDGPRFDPQGRQRCGVTSGAMSLAIFQFLHILTAAEAEDWEEVAQAQQAVTALFSAMQDDPRKFADLQRAKYIMGLGHPLAGRIEAEQAERVLAALAALPRDADRRRLARSLDLMGDGPYHQRLASLC